VATRFERIVTIMAQNFRPTHLALRDTSSDHGDHFFSQSDETHFQLIVESRKFEGMSQVQMHQAIYMLLDREFHSGLHAIAIHASPPKPSDTPD